MPLFVFDEETISTGTAAVLKFEQMAMVLTSNIHSGFSTGQR